MALLPTLELVLKGGRKGKCGLRGGLCGGFARGRLARARRRTQLASERSEWTPALYPPHGPAGALKGRVHGRWESQDARERQQRSDQIWWLQDFQTVFTGHAGAVGPILSGNSKGAKVQKPKLRGLCATGIELQETCKYNWFLWFLQGHTEHSYMEIGFIQHLIFSQPSNPLATLLETPWIKVKTSTQPPSTEGRWGAGLVSPRNFCNHIS